MGDEIININLAIHIPINNFRNISSSASSAKGRAAPYSSCYKLKRPSGNFLPRAGNPNDYTFAPSLMTTLQCLTHCVDIPNTFEAVVSTSVGQIAYGFY